MEMKMVLFSNLFWGIIIVLFGISVILKAMGVIQSVPLFRIFIAVILIFWGINMLIGFHGTPKSANRGKVHISSGTGSEFSVVFSSGTVDLTNREFRDGENIEVTAVFGSNFVTLPRDYHFHINPTAVFGSVRIPSKMGAKNGLPTVYIEANAVFGRVEFEQRPFQPRDPGVKPDQSDSTKVNQDNY